MQRFAGFPEGSRLSPATFPTHFFSDLLPMIDDLAELKLTLFCFWALGQKEGLYRYLRWADFSTQPILLESLTSAVPAVEPLITLENALARALERGTLLLACVPVNGANERLYFINTPRGRVAVAQIAAGEWRFGGEGNPVDILPERPNIYRLYEENIGALTPMLGDALKDAETDYPAQWIEEAIREAAHANKRNWRYIQAMLKRWEAEGKSRERVGRFTEQDGERYISGPYADFIQHG